MYGLVNSNFSRTYNPSGRQNALSDIKRLLTSRDTEAQNKACGYLIEVIGRYGKTSTEGTRLVEYLLDNDITVFLCEATSNLDFSLFRYVMIFSIYTFRFHSFCSTNYILQGKESEGNVLLHYTVQYL